MAEMQAKLEEMEIEGSAGAGMVSLVLSGKGALKRIKIDPQAGGPGGDRDDEDLLVAAHADAKRKLEAPDGRGDGAGDRRPAAAWRDEAAVLRQAAAAGRVWPPG